MQKSYEICRHFSSYNLVRSLSLYWICCFFFPCVTFLENRKVMTGLSRGSNSSNMNSSDHVSVDCFLFLFRFILCLVFVCVFSWFCVFLIYVKFCQEMVKNQQIIDEDHLKKMVKRGFLKFVDNF